MTNRAFISRSEATNSFTPEPAVTLRGDGGTHSDKGPLGHVIGEEQRRSIELKRQIALAKKSRSSARAAQNDAVEVSRPGSFLDVKGGVEHKTSGDEPGSVDSALCGELGHPGVEQVSTSSPFHISSDDEDSIFYSVFSDRHCTEAEKKRRAQQ